MLEALERTRGLERLDVQLERLNAVAAGAAARVLLQRGRMRRAVGAGKNDRFPTSRRDQPRRCSSRFSTGRR
jgi:hypothetical protein